ncbi:nicotinate phosphoribosyltransferase [Candidatus Parcubacteria bacterium]|jgi:nicotinate phosphoribosyltransferase|nr:nicotinate phosphoribosyltransferase [Candidatus Parcubacteria bacterium]
MDRPIIKSLMDLDFYKLTMGQLIFLMYAHIPVTFSFINRSIDVQLPKHINVDELREQLEHARTLRINPDELGWLVSSTSISGKRILQDPYLKFLSTLRLPEFNLEVDDDRRLHLQFYGPWSTVVYWETIALSIINEMWCQSQMKDMSRFERDLILTEGKMRLGKKIALLNQPQCEGLTFSDFGTRRRFSGDWQSYVVDAMANELTQAKFRGTSNVRLAMDHHLRPIGTSAHELPMIMSGIMHKNDDSIRASNQQVLTDWWNLYGHELSIFLPDTYGTKFFFDNLTHEQVVNWRGFRHDSGDAIEFGEKVISFYQSHDVDPREKIVVFSDGLDIEKIIKFYGHFKGRIDTDNGWGTTLTNDMGLRTLSLVVKATEACGHGLVKLSDNLAKATGNPTDVERFKKIFGHTVTTRTECKV